ncbi:hypothetical protein LJR230_002194 [Trinickia sp. LjRoot230]|uniref:hypothetical protein n=1 Tax=Trinickia sp. LjRoot230 TaxID=3342288 RepID=UPI003ECDF46A
MPNPLGGCGTQILTSGHRMTVMPSRFFERGARLLIELARIDRELAKYIAIGISGRHHKMRRAGRGHDLGIQRIGAECTHRFTLVTGQRCFSLGSGRTTWQHTRHGFAHAKKRIRGCLHARIVQIDPPWQQPRNASKQADFFKCGRPNNTSLHTCVMWQEVRGGRESYACIFPPFRGIGPAHEGRRRKGIQHLKTEIAASQSAMGHQDSMPNIPRPSLRLMPVVQHFDGEIRIVVSRAGQRLSQEDRMSAARPAVRTDIQEPLSEALRIGRV